MLKQAKENKPPLSHLISHLKVNNKEKIPREDRGTKHFILGGGTRITITFWKRTATYSVLRGRGIAATICTS